MTEAHQAAARYVGIDVSKDHLDVALLPSGQSWRCTNDPDGIDALTTEIASLRPTLIVLEATGGHEHAVAAALAAAGLPVAVINPRQMRDFARATGELAKTDMLDARVLARFAERVRPEPRVLPDRDQRALEALLSRRRQLIGMLVAERHRQLLADGAIQGSLRRHVTWLEAELASVEAEMAEAIEASPVWRAREHLLRSVPGVGRVLATMLVADLPELGRLNRKQIAKLAGVAPLARESGRWRGQRITWGGRAEVRSALYMGALVASRFNGPLRVFYERLVGTGKPKKVALVAVMRRLLVILNAMVRDGQVWNAEMASARA